MKKSLTNLKSRLLGDKCKIKVEGLVLNNYQTLSVEGRVRHKGEIKIPYKDIEHVDNMRGMDREVTKKLFFAGLAIIVYDKVLGNFLLDLMDNWILKTMETLVFGACILLVIIFAMKNRKQLRIETKDKVYCVQRGKTNLLDIRDRLGG